MVKNTEGGEHERGILLVVWMRGGIISALIKVKIGLYTVKIIVLTWVDSRVQC